MKIFLFLLGLTLTLTYCDNDVDANFDDDYNSLDVYSSLEFENNFEQKDPHPEMTEAYEEANDPKTSTVQPETSGLDDWLEEHLIQWLRSNVLATILIGITVFMLACMIVCICTFRTFRRNVQNVKEHFDEMFEMI